VEKQAKAAFSTFSLCLLTLQVRYNSICFLLPQYLPQATKTPEFVSKQIVF
jgi:hypothetical protein